MAASTTQRPAALPPTNKPAARTPRGAAKMAKMYLDAKGVPQRSLHPVPVDEDERRTAHLLHQCTHMRNLNGGGKERCGEQEWLLPDDPPVYCRLHGKKPLEPVKEGPSQLERTLVAAKEMHGRSALPWLIPGGMALTDLALHLCGIGIEAGVLTPILAGAGYLSAKQALTAKAIERRRLEKGEKTGRRAERIRKQARRFAWYGAEAGLWAAALGGTDITDPLPGTLVAALGMTRWAIACHGWWKSADERRTAASQVKVDVAEAVASTPQVAVPDPVQLKAETTWTTLIGCQGGAFPGTRLEEFTRLPNCQVRASERTLVPNWSAKVVALVPGSINMRENRPNLRGRIAAAFGCTYADVSFHADDNDLSVGMLRVQPDNPLAEVKMWPGIGATDWAKGTSDIGPFDDSTPVRYQWWTKEGAAHDLIGGSSGSGKSELVAQLLLTSLHSNGLVLDWVGDPQGGQSFGALKDHVDWFAHGEHEITLMLLAAVKEMYRRNDVLTSAYIKTWKPTADMPLLVITLDEIQSYLGDTGPIHELVTKLAGMGRKVGIKMRLITQIIAAYNLGGDTYIKDQVKTGQTLTFRSETDQAARSAIEGDSPIDPTMLPKTWGPKTCAAGERTAGLVFLQGLHGRDLYARAYYTGESMDQWLIGDDGTPTVSPGTFCADARRTSGVLWGDRKKRAKRLLEAGRSDEEILSGGAAVELIEAASVSAQTGEVVKPADHSQAPLENRSRDNVLAAVFGLADENGMVKRDAIAAAVKGKMAEGTMNKALTDLVGSGDLLRPKNGIYMVAGMAPQQMRIDEVEQ